MGQLKTGVRRTNQTASSGLQVEALARNSEVTTAEEARVSTKANVVDRFQNNPNRMANRPPHKPELGHFSISFASQREIAALSLSNHIVYHAIRLCEFCLLSFPRSRYV